MALDLANGYIRKDGSSASNVYYGYSFNSSASDTDKVFAIRKVSTAGGVETVTWTNGTPLSYINDWAGRTYSFAVPGGSLNLTYSTTTITETSTSGTYSFTYAKSRFASFTWSSINGVSKYIVTSKDGSGNLLGIDGAALRGQYVTRNYTTELFNLTSYSQGYLDAGTYTLTITAVNVAGSISSTTTFNFVL
jgi:hypothetical protein